MKKIGWEWLQDNHHRFVGQEVWSMDGFFNGHRTLTHLSIALRGAPPPNYTGSISTYTSFAVGCISSRGRQMKCMVFTKDPAFDRTRNSTKTRKELLAKIDEAAKLYGIDADRVIYVKPVGGESKNFVAEKAQFVDLFLKRFKVQNGPILSDGGNAFSDAGERRGWADHLVYPSCVHQLLSPNDNRWHGAGKQDWRLSGIDFSDNIVQIFCMMHCMDKAAGECKKWFKANLQTNRAQPSREVFDRLFSGKSAVEMQKFEAARKAFIMHEGLDPRGEGDVRLEDGLDGFYWVNK